MDRHNPLRKPKPEKVKASEKVIANKNSIDAVNKCPAPGCNNTMKILECNGVDAYVCLDHRIALPVKNEETTG